jgi:hypothetical protein
MPDPPKPFAEVIALSLVSNILNAAGLIFPSSGIYVFNTILAASSFLFNAFCA